MKRSLLCLVPLLLPAVAHAHGERVAHGDIRPANLRVDDEGHLFLLDWGMGVDGKGGKAAYVDAWWNAVDWEKVHQRAGVTRPEFMTENSP